MMLLNSSNIFMSRPFQLLSMLAGNPGQRLVTNIVDSGPLSVPIPLPLAGLSLQRCIDERETQATPHALRSDHGFLLFRRHSVVGGNVCKHQRGISVHPGQIFGTPVSSPTTAWRGPCAHIGSSLSSTTLVTVCSQDI